MARRREGGNRSSLTRPIRLATNIIVTESALPNTPTKKPPNPDVRLGVRTARYRTSFGRSALPAGTRPGDSPLAGFVLYSNP